MNDIDPKALEHACQCAGRSVHHFDRMGDDLPLRASIIAHARAIEQHEAFRQEVSNAIDSSVLTPETEAHLSRFIIAKPVDPLVEALQAVDEFASPTWVERIAPQLRAALAARGLKIVEDKP